MMAIHDEDGCQHTDRTKDGIDLVCRCGLSPDAIAESNLATLREAGEKMAEQLRQLEGAGFTDAETRAALAEWEAANK